mmetsp:Transcript_81047/g.164138  ORF Transcript_81047/g.164138 Transcript_81047/m.164138 type:complete len:383 (-) Transcript_81047:330-1478(-)
MDWSCLLLKIVLVVIVVRLGQLEQKIVGERWVFHLVGDGVGKVDDPIARCAAAADARAHGFGLSEKALAFGGVVAVLVIVVVVVARRRSLSLQHVQEQIEDPLQHRVSEPNRLGRDFREFPPPQVRRFDDFLQGKRRRRRRDLVQEPRGKVGRNDLSVVLDPVRVVQPLPKGRVFPPRPKLVVGHIEPVPQEISNVLSFQVVQGVPKRMDHVLHRFDAFRLFLFYLRDRLLDGLFVARQEKEVDGQYVDRLRFLVARENHDAVAVLDPRLGQVVSRFQYLSLPNDALGGYVVAPVVPGVVHSLESRGQFVHGRHPVPDRVGLSPIGHVEVPNGFHGRNKHRGKTLADGIAVCVAVDVAVVSVTDRFQFRDGKNYEGGNHDES